MPSLFAGDLKCRRNRYEIHAFTQGQPFRDYPTSEIADDRLFQKLIEGRHEVLASGEPIYCTAISPDNQRKIEINPHDTREGTVHFAALDRDGRINCALSCAVDSGKKHRGEIGVRPRHMTYSSIQARAAPISARRLQAAHVSSVRF